MRKPNNYENTQAQGEFTPVELGGHTLVIKQVEERMSKTNKPMIVVFFDFAPGDKQAGYFAESFKNDIRPDKKWSGAVEEDLYKTVARNCFRYFGFTSFKQVDQLTLAEYELMMEALELRMLDESLHEHRQAFLNFAVKAEKKAGKGKTKPVYKRFRQFFDFDKELKKMKNRRKPSRFAGITKLLDREE